MRPSASRVNCCSKIGDAAVRGGVLHRLGEAVVRPGVGDVAQRRAGQEPVLRAARQRHRAGRRQQAVGVVAERYRRAVDCNPGHPEVVVVGARHRSCDRTAPGHRLEQGAVVGVGQAEAVGGCDRRHLPGRRAVGVADRAARDGGGVQPSRRVVAERHGLPVGPAHLRQLPVDVVGVERLVRAGTDVGRHVRGHQVDRRVGERVRGSSGGVSEVRLPLAS